MRSESPINVEISGICGRVRCEAGWRLDPSWSARLEDFDLWLVWAGHGTMKLQDRTLPLRPGVCLWMRPGRSYVASQDSHNRLGVIFIHFRLPQDPGHRPAFEITTVQSLAFVDSMMAEIVRRQARQPELANRLLGDLLETLVCDHQAAAGDRPDRLSGARSRRVEQIRGLVNRIREEPGKNWKVGEMARKLGIAPDHFSRVFQQFVGERPQSLVMRLRLQRAQELLLETPLQVGEVAHALGFRDIFYFSRQFSKHFGVPPSVYRKNGGQIPFAERESSA